MSNKGLVAPSIDITDIIHISFDSTAQMVMSEGESSCFRLLTLKTKPKSSLRLVYIADPFRLRWDVVIMICALYNSVTAPYTVSFKTEMDLMLVFEVVDLLIDIMFIIDIYLNFITSYFDPSTGEEVTSRRNIAKHYIKSGRFFIDLFACLPIYLVTLLFNTESWSLVKLLKLIRILRLSKMIYYMRVSKEIKVPLRLCKVVLYVIVYLHMLACAWNMAIALDYDWTPPPYLAKPSYTSYESLSNYEKYSYCFYTAIYTLVGIEILPTNNLEYSMAALFIIVGAVLFSIILGEISSLVFSIRNDVVRFNKSMDSIASTMCCLKLNNALQMEIADYFKSTHQFCMSNQESEGFFELIPQSLVREITHFLYFDFISSQPVLADFPESCNLIVSKLQHCFYKPGAMLILYGQESTEFYLIMKGEFEVWVEGLDNTDHYVRTLRKDDYCGELGLLYGLQRTATVQATTYATVCLLKKPDFFGVMQAHPQLERAMKAKVSRYDDPYRRGIQVRFM